MAAASINPLEQFALLPIGPFGGAALFSQSNLFMLASGLLILGVLIVGMRPRAVVPGRLQALAELCYGSLMTMTVDTIGVEGRQFFPFVFTLFFFVLLGNVLGLLPFAFTYTSEIVVTGALALVVVAMATIVAFWKHGLGFLRYFLPEGVPIYLAPLIIPLEVVSYLSRIVSLSVRLFANMVAGHIMLSIFAGFVVMLGGLGWYGAVAGVVPLAFSVVLIGFELLVAFLQAYVFAILTCIYLHDAVHLH